MTRTRMRARRLPAHLTDSALGTQKQSQSIDLLEPSQLAARETGRETGP